VFEVSDKVTVHARGQVTLSCPTSETNVRGLVKAMLQDKVVATPTYRGSAHEGQEPVLEVRSLRVGTKLSGVSFEVGGRRDHRPPAWPALVGRRGAARSSATSVATVAMSRCTASASGRATLRRHPTRVYLVPEDRAVARLILTKPIVREQQPLGPAPRGVHGVCSGCAWRARGPST
jgi:ABC-type sugar transport system ATPase subunit